MARKSVVGLVALACLMLIPASALAQSGIAGVVRDTTGAVLPGVTVEASSPALIEKVRIVVTNDEGLYKLVDLRPGVYAVTFALSGFSTLKREGIELTTNFTTTVNVEMSVGDLAETITVSAQNPLVDVQNVVRHRTVTSEVVDALPTARSPQNIAGLIPGMVVTTGNRPSGQDVGGLSGERQGLAIHGSRSGDLTLQLEGLQFGSMNSASSSGYTPDVGEIQEYSYEYGAISAQNATGGVQFNLIPKEGGNVFKGTVFGSFSSHSMRNDNLTDNLRARGLAVGNELDKIWDVNASDGGPIKRDKLWFFGSYRYWGLNDLVAGMWYAKNPYAFVFDPDLSRRASDDSWNTSEGLRLTWQATRKNKLSLYFGDQHRCQCHWHVSGVVAPEAAEIQRSPIDLIGQASWSSPVTNRLLLEAGVLRLRYEYNPVYQPGVTPDIFSTRELSTGLLFRAAQQSVRQRHETYSYRGALSYVTGSHAFKVGFNVYAGTRRAFTEVNGDMNLQLLNGVPRAVVVWATPWTATEHLNESLGIFAQDQWRIKRLTLNLGTRFDFFNGSVAEQHMAPVRFVGARDFAAVPDVPNWTDLEPRLGASFDLFGTGKTAVKVSLSRYVAAETVSFASMNNPINTSVNSATRTWTDLNGDFVPQENELGPLSDANFGKVNIATRFDDAVRQGFGSRGFNWETSAGLQHELLTHVSVDASYHRRWYGNFKATDNLSVTPADYDPFCITAPVDARLPGGGGNQICGLYDLTPAKFGQVNNLVTFAKNVGKRTEVYDGVDLGMNVRLPRGGMVLGGLNTGRSATSNCVVIDDPTVRRFCDITPPFLTQVKFLGTFSLPWGLQASGTYQSIPGPEITASYVVTNEQIRGSLGRDLAQGARGTKTVALIQPGTTYDDRMHQVDVRVAKILKVGRTRIKGSLDLYNALNASPVLTVNNQYGQAWLRPTYILPGRLIKFAAQIDF